MCETDLPTLSYIFPLSIQYRLIILSQYAYYFSYIFIKLVHTMFRSRDIITRCCSNLVSSVWFRITVHVISFVGLTLLYILQFNP